MDTFLGTMIRNAIMWPDNRGDAPSDMQLIRHGCSLWLARFLKPRDHNDMNSPDNYVS